MPGGNKKDGCCTEDDNITLRSLKLELKAQNRGSLSLSKRGIRKGSDNVMLKKKILKKAIARKNRSYKKEPSLSSIKAEALKSRNKECGKADVNPRKQKRRKNRKNNVELDEASRLQRRTRYLLVKLKLEQNLIDAYAAEGWKGQSREKIKPEKELRKAGEQILKCKLGIREAIHQLDLLSSEGCPNVSKTASDGTVHHKNVVCARCKEEEALSDNNIILCNGTCGCGFHKKCIDPPLPSKDKGEGWFCKFCDKKREILEATNAHLGTHFPLESNWEDVFREEAALPEVGSSVLLQEEEWPSDDSEDADYDPSKINSCCDDQPGSESDASGHSSSFLGSLEDESVLASGGVEEDSSRSYNKFLRLIEDDSDDINGGEVSGPRQRAAVDYIKLYDEMFGKNDENEQISEDEDWGPSKRKRKAKESDAATTLMALGETDVKDSQDMPSISDSIEEAKKRALRIPPEAVEKLRLVFAENELPERTLRVELSRQLGLEIEKVNKWFKNARYVALKARKADRAKEVAEFIGKKADSLTSSYNKAEDSQDNGDDVSLKYLREKAREAKRKSSCNKSMLKAEAHIEKLYRIKTRVDRIRQLLLRLPIRRSSKCPAESSIMYVPVAEVREKR